MCISFCPGGIRPLCVCVCVLSHLIALKAEIYELQAAAVCQQVRLLFKCGNNNSSSNNNKEKKNAEVRRETPPGSHLPACRMNTKNPFMMLMGCCCKCVEGKKIHCHNKAAARADALFNTIPASRFSSPAQVLHYQSPIRRSCGEIGVCGAARALGS